MGTFIALALGMAILSMTSLLLVSSSARTPDRYDGARILVASATATHGSDDFTAVRPFASATVRQLTGQLAQVPGVTAAVPDRSFYAQAVMNDTPVGDPPAGDLEGHGWASAALAPYPLVAGSPPTGKNDVVVDRALGVPPGSSLTLLTASGPAQWTVTGTVDAPGFWVSDATAAGLAGGVRVIGLVTRPDADLTIVKSAAGTITGSRATVLSGDARSAVEPPFEGRMRWIGSQVLSAMASLAAFVAVFVAASTFAFSVVQRRRELGLLRVVGATPRQVRRLMFGEALVIGVSASAVGVLLGAAVAPPVGRVLVDNGFEPADFGARYQALPLLGSFAVGVVVAMLGVWAASRRAAKVHPLEALRDAAVDQRPMTRPRWIGGLGLTGAGMLMAFAATTVQSDDLVNLTLCTAMVLIVGLTLLAPAVIGPIARAVTFPLRRLRGATGMLVREGAATAVRRTASTAVPVLVTVTFAVLIGGLVQTTAGAYALRRTNQIHATAVVLPHGTPGLSDAAIADVQGTAYLPTTVYPDGPDRAGRSYRGTGIAPDQFSREQRLMKVVRGRVADLRGDDTVLASEWVAREQGGSFGGPVRLTTEDGQSPPLRLVGILADDTAPADVVLPRAFVRTHDPSALTDLVLASGRPVAPASTVGAEVVDLGHVREERRRRGGQTGVDFRPAADQCLGGLLGDRHRQHADDGHCRPDPRILRPAPVRRHDRSGAAAGGGGVGAGGDHRHAPRFDRRGGCRAEHSGRAQRQGGRPGRPGAALVDRPVGGRRLPHPRVTGHRAAGAGGAAVVPPPGNLTRPRLRRPDRCLGGRGHRSG